MLDPLRPLGTSPEDGGGEKKVILLPREAGEVAEGRRGSCTFSFPGVRP